MTVTVTNILAGPFYPNGVTLSFPFTFKALSAAELRVFTRLGASDVVVDSGLYSVAMESDEEGGTVVFNTAPPASVGALYIEGMPSFGQPTSFNNNGFLPRTITPQLDRAALRDLFLLSRIARSLTAPAGDVLADLPGAASRSLRLLAFDLYGNPVSGPSIDDVQSAIANATAALANKSLAAAVTYYQRGAAFGVVGRTVEDRQRETISVKDFGAVGDGVSRTLATRFATLGAAQAFYPNCGVAALTDQIDGIAIQAALNYAKSLNNDGNNGGYLVGAEVYAPTGRYFSSRSLKLPTTVSFRGDGIGRTILDAQNVTLNAPWIIPETTAYGAMHVRDMSIHGGTWAVRYEGDGLDSFNFINLSMVGQSAGNIFIERLAQIGRVEGCWFGGVAFGGTTRSDYGFHAPNPTTNVVRFVGNTFEGHRRSSIRISNDENRAASGGEGLIITGGRFEGGALQASRSNGISISGITLTVGSIFEGTVEVGDVVVETGIKPGTKIIARVTGTGGVGTYTVNVAQTFTGGASFYPPVIDIHGVGNMLIEGVYFENCHRYVLAESGYRAGVTFNNNHFTYLQEEAFGGGSYGAIIPFEFSSEGPIYFGTNDMNGLTKPPVNAVIQGNNPNLRGKVPHWTSRTGFSGKVISGGLTYTGGGTTYQILTFNRGSSAAFVHYSGTLRLRVAGGDSPLGTLFQFTRLYNVQIVSGLVVSASLVNEVGTHGTSTITVSATGGATSTSAGLSLNLADVNGAIMTHASWSFEFDGMSDDALYNIDVVSL